MKKILSLVLAFSLISTFSFSQASFGLVENAGFNGDNGTISSLCSFKGNLYAGTGNYSALIYKSSTGDLATFSSVYSNMIFGNVKHMTVTNDGSGYMFAALKGGAGYARKIFKRNVRK
jgi:hypothetical protein